MKNIASQEYQKESTLLIEYQRQLTLSLSEIKTVINLLDQPIATPNEEQKLWEKVALANRLVTQVTQRLEYLEQQRQLLQDEPRFAEIENHEAIRDLMAHKLEEIRQKTEQWKYIA
ncbi:hypothetical protein VB715_08430 [Crocosphaera sp. UHCC 0190]|uniref:hypothetical protein n=1 Tax=Crocosphaera sp. UHCC 0190 TaxID=3110246 RepID=UPI002B1F8A86|nr:hypothetical protein [Crocosphaera sp. UHCC 0190]MEA5509789.1 hypothetical protein [Crocosphaera sp. UHCC 0190]